MKLKHIHQKKRYTIRFNMTPSRDVVIVNGYGKRHIKRLISKYKKRLHNLYGNKEGISIFIDEIRNFTNNKKYAGERYRDGDSQILMYISDDYDRVGSIISKVDNDTFYI